MNNSTIISVIVPIYNCEKYIEKCIKSIMYQTFKSFELILINDGSTDSSLEICKKYSCIDKRIVLINQKNVGVSKTREKGISLANGKYIFFIDSDDYINKNCLETMFKSINESKADIVCCNSVNFGADVKEPVNIKSDEIITDKERIYDDYFLRYRYTCTLWGKLFNKNILKKLDFPNMRYAEDTFLILKIFNQAEKIHLIKYIGYNYRIQSQSVSNTLDDYTKLTDILKRDRLACDICRNLKKSLKQKAFNNFSDDLYALVVLYAREKDVKILEKINNAIYINYNYIKKYVKKNGIKLKIVKAFCYNRYLIKKVIQVIYFFKTKL